METLAGLLMSVTSIKWLRIKRSFEAPSAGEVKYNIPQGFLLSFSHGMPSEETGLGLLVNPGTPVFTAWLRACQLQFETETSNSLIHSNHEKGSEGPGSVLGMEATNIMP